MVSIAQDICSCFQLNSGFCVKWPPHMHQVEEWLKTCKLSDLTKDDFFEIKRKGFSDAQLARFLGTRSAFSRQEQTGRLCD